MVSGSPVVLITAFPLIDAGIEFEAHSLYAPTEKGDAMFRAKGPSIANEPRGSTFAIKRDGGLKPERPLNCRHPSSARSRQRLCRRHTSII